MSIAAFALHTPVRRLLSLLGALVLAGCSSLAPVGPREATQAISDVRHTRLASLLRAATPASAGTRSGFRLLADGEHALDARLALIEQAQSSLDVQYYEIADDSTGRQFVGALRAAAGRGVRVRVLVDDLYTPCCSGLLADLAARPGVALRVFNPLPARNGSLAGRVVASLHELERINGRMHNKLLVADHSFALAGGRNIAPTSAATNPRASSTWTSWPPGLWWPSFPMRSTASGTATAPIRRRTLHRGPPTTARVPAVSRRHRRARSAPLWRPTASASRR